MYEDLKKISFTKAKQIGLAEYNSNNVSQLDLFNELGSVNGAFILQIKGLDRCTISELQEIAYILLAPLGEPFGPFQKHGLWKGIGVKPNIDPWRVEGTGYIPFHSIAIS